MATTDFTCFSRLPPELRIKVWRIHCCNDSRSIELKWDRRPQPNGDLEYQWTSKTPAPSLLQVNQESRYEGLKFYQLSFAHQTAYDKTIPATIYFNPFIDILHFPFDTLRKLFEAWFDSAFNQPGQPVLDDGEVYVQEEIKVDLPFPEDMKSLKSISVETELFGDDSLHRRDYNAHNRWHESGYHLQMIMEEFPNLEKFYLIHSISEFGDPTAITPFSEEELQSVKDYVSIILGPGLREDSRKALGMVYDTSDWLNEWYNDHIQEQIKQVAQVPENFQYQLSRWVSNVTFCEVEKVDEGFLRVGVEVTRSADQEDEVEEQENEDGDEDGDEQEQE